MANLPPFQRFLDEHREDVLRFLIASLGRDDADDAFQETFISALRSYERLRPDSNLRGWVLTIAHRKALDVHRGRARRPLPVAELDDRATPVAGARAEGVPWGEGARAAGAPWGDGARATGAPWGEGARAAGAPWGAGGGGPSAGDGPDPWERVRALPPRQRAVLTLRYAAGLTHAEIAAALACSEDAARRAASDGLKTLREELTDVPAPT